MMPSHSYLAILFSRLMNHTVYPDMEYEYLWKSATLKIQKNEKRLLLRVVALLYAYSVFMYLRRNCGYEEHIEVAELYIDYTKACLLYYFLFPKGSQSRKWGEQKRIRKRKLAAELNTVTCRKCGSIKKKSKMYSRFRRGRAVFVCQKCPSDKREKKRKQEKHRNRYSNLDRSSSATDRDGRDNYRASQEGSESLQRERHVLSISQ